MLRWIGILGFAYLSLLTLFGIVIFALLGAQRPSLALIGIPTCLVCFAISASYLRMIWKRQTKADGSHVNAWLYLVLGVIGVALPVWGLFFGDFRKDILHSLHLTALWESAGWAAILTSIQRIRRGQVRADTSIADPGRASPSVDDVDDDAVT